jgi:hypothetical protein
MVFSGIDSIKYVAVSLLLLMATFSITSCEEEELPPPKEVNPDDLKYEGNWYGSSSQTKLLSFHVVNLDSVPLIPKCEIGYVSGKAFKKRFFTDVTGLSEIKNGSFSVQFPDGGSLNGDFLSSEVCSGTLIIADEFSGELSSHYFEMTTDTSSSNILSPAKVSFTIEDKRYEFVQDDIFYLPTKENVKTGTGFIAKSGLQKPGNESSVDVQIITINAGRITSLDSIPFKFAPGVKKYSIGAVDGFEITLSNPAEFFSFYSSSHFTGDQTGSVFEIIEIKEIPTLHNDFKLYKFSARFNCKVYRMEGQKVSIENGFYIGYLDAGYLQ